MLRYMVRISMLGIMACGNIAADEPTKDAILLTTPKIDWVLEVGDPNMILFQKEVAWDGKTSSFRAENKITGIKISGFLEDRGKTGTSNQCRDYYWAKAKQSPLKKDNITKSDMGNVALLEYRVKEFRGITVNQKHMNA